ncbi:MAG: hypothetical protein FWG98_01640 [Candidatus Cloacimonetes bacterium]|nr:hypothetical protein [Candidatus Cloacimonadota bacterium]
MNKHEEEILEIRKDAERIRRETDAIRKETESIRQESEAIRKETDELRKINERLDIEAKERWEKLEALSKESLNRMAELESQIGGIANSNGKLAETYFFNSLKNSMSYGGREFDEIDQGLRKTKKLPEGNHLRGEYDIIMYNGDTIALIEIKYKLNKEDVEKLLGKKLHIFKQLFPKFEKYDFLLGVAGMSFELGAEEEALENGIGILRPKGESVEILDQNLKVY